MASASVTLTIPDETKEELNGFAWVIWSEVAGESFSEKLRRDKLFEGLNKLLENSELTEEDCLRLGDEVKQRAWKKLKKEGW